MRIHGAGLALVVVAPALHQQLLAAHHQPAVYHEAAQEGVFLRRQRKLAAPGPDAPGRVLEHDAAGLHAAAREHLTAAALYERRRFGVEHREREGFRHIVVRAQLVAEQLVLLVGERGEQYYRHVVVPAQGAADGKSVQLRHHDVQQHGVKLRVLDKLQRTQAVFGLEGRVAPAAEVVADDLTQPGLVLDYQDTKVHVLTPPMHTTIYICILCVNIPAGYTETRRKICARDDANWIQMYVTLQTRGRSK